MPTNIIKFMVFFMKFPPEWRLVEEDSSRYMVNYYDFLIFSQNKGRIMSYLWSLPVFTKCLCSQIISKIPGMAISVQNKKKPDQPNEPTI